AVEHPATPFLIVLFTFWTIGASNEQTRVIAGAVVGVAAVAAVVANDPQGHVSNFFFVSLFGLIAWVAGVAYARRLASIRELRQRAEQLEREHAEGAAQA